MMVLGISWAERIRPAAAVEGILVAHQLIQYITVGYTLIREEEALQVNHAPNRAE